VANEAETDTLRRLENAVANLPWLQRQVFLARRVDGLSYAEIAYLTGLSERYIERQMAKAIHKLAKQMDGEKLRWWERWL
jgi:RNA polymerase sigma-70 factor (ECF subfamily)